METLSCYEGLIRTVIFLFLLFIPIIWIYAQMLFFKKREKEFYILSAISAPPSTIRRIYFSGSVMMIPVAILSILFSGILYGCLFLLFERFLPNVLGIGGAISHAVSVPLYVYLIGIFTTLLSCVISVALPYFSFKKKQASETIANDFHSDAH